MNVTRCPLATNLAEFGPETLLAGHRAADGVLAPDTVARAGAGSESSWLAPHLTPGVWMTSSTSWLLLARKFFFTFHFFHIAPDLIVGVGDRLAKRFHLLLWSNAQADLEQGGQLLNAERPTSTPLRENSGTVTSHPSVVKLSALNLAGRRVDPVFAALAHLIVREWCLA